MLKTKAVGEYTVSEAGPLEAARAVYFSNQYQVMLDAAKAKGEDATEDDLERLQALSLWAEIGAVISPRIGADDWMQIPLTIITELKAAARELNPSWFVDVTEKKRDNRRRKSMSK